MFLIAVGENGFLMKASIFVCDSMFWNSLSWISMDSFEQRNRIAAPVPTTILTVNQVLYPVT
jgi:hypothetical protein